ncbi:cleavage stimulation factor subunit 2-like isoform X1 [Daphnia carinata]|uniref:cleavage stimulation factor subunit 2-like isoform X1 n=1 Tax=Daphnia carinata TaxID=120202 RepID=UPI0025800C68|nr:cleavage stimulation factor subunit 2-like isoform X1 [Daphnia carinata]
MATDPQIVIDKSLRSVFVGNIPYDVTEEKLKDIFSEAGPVVSFKIVYDRETGKPKGYGFCEYRDQETALCAMRNLNGYEIAGRTLRVDNACTEKSRLEMQSLMQEKTTESPYGDVVDPTQAPEMISKAVSSLPPEQMFELMQQMKQCIQNNPNEARQMLLQNPQLAYALLQALVVMRVVDPNNALSMLQKGPGQTDVGMGAQHFAKTPNFPIPSNEPWVAGSGSRQALLGDRPFAGQDLDLRHADPRMGRGDHDLRVPPAAPMPAGGIGMQPTMQQQQQPIRPPQTMPEMDSRRDPRSSGPTGPRDPRAGMSRQGPGPGVPPVPVPQPNVPSALAGAALNAQTAAAPTAGAIGRALGPGTSDQEKAALIMQVLQLSDEQIALLPPDQRQSIMVLKEQIARSSR